ncbi:HAD-IA family hydrolase [Micromonospora sp. Llam7]|uniref:HAD-IA family hydrolase n=1 Tax=Micromonospora tarapacensis TaxID=2835305 RepID=UPI001C8358FA|nr:HAD-IA family hydrolase [Micromonospora tarapacensis]MBX7267731.1 HAD-IA family hydrolase [Micromonospora tarapacensis]
MAVLFDNDGTLVDSTSAITRCWDRWRTEYRVDQDRFHKVDFFGRPVREIVSDILPRELVHRAALHYEEMEAADTECVVLPGVLNLLADLPAPRWAVVTSASRKVAELRLARLGVRIPQLVCADDVRCGKPDPEPYLLAARRLGVDPATCIVVEDAPMGLVAAKAAGMHTIAVTSTHARNELRADIVIDTLAQIRVRHDDQLVHLEIDGQAVGYTRPTGIPVSYPSGARR